MGDKRARGIPGFRDDGVDMDMDMGTWTWTWTWTSEASFASGPTAGNTGLQRFTVHHQSHQRYLLAHIHHG